jgi:hypothetical protein
MDLYVSSGALAGGSIPGKTSAAVIGLSATLKQLGAYPPELQRDKYRNEDGVYLKLTNLRAVETEGQHGMNAYSQMDAAVWRDFADRIPELQAQAAAIRAGIDTGTVQPASTEPKVDDVPIENQNTESYTVNPSSTPRVAQRAEQALVRRYRDHMATKGVAVTRKRYLPRGEVRPIFSDAWAEARNVLVEAKNSDSRDSLRQAIGQLLDYRRFHEPGVNLAVLLPYKPMGDRLDLLTSAGLAAIWPIGDGFRDSAGGQFV